jgi:hypothetical protein
MGLKTITNNLDLAVRNGIINQMQIELPFMVLFAFGW